MYRGLLARIGKSKGIEKSKALTDEDSSPRSDSIKDEKAAISLPEDVYPNGTSNVKKESQDHSTESTSLLSKENINKISSTSTPSLKDSKEEEEEQQQQQKDQHDEDDSVKSESSPGTSKSPKSPNSSLITRPPKRQTEPNAETSERPSKSSRVDFSPPFYRPYGPQHMHPLPEPFWRRGGPFRGGPRGRGMNPAWRGGPFPRPFPPGPFFNYRPPPKQPFHSPPTNGPRLSKPTIQQQRFFVPPPSVEDRPFNSSSSIILDQVTPLWSTPYDKQLKIKEDKVLAFMSRLKTETLNANRALHAWYSFQENSYPSICKLQPMAPAPLTLGYLSRCDLSIGLDKNSDQLSVGYRIETDHSTLGSIDKLKNIPKRIHAVTKCLERFLRTSAYEPYDPKSQTGNWLGCTLRLTITDELMVILIFHSQGLDKLRIKEIRLKLKDFFERGDGKDMKISSLYFNEKTLEDSGTFELILGVDHISEKICDQYFRITPRIPFCRSTSGMETVFKVMIDACCLDSETTLVDLCCGGGTIGLSLSQHVGQVLGLDIVEEFINDARTNAVNNSVTNCEFFTGSGEHYLPVLLNRANFSNIVLVVEPPDIPFDSKVICNIRKCSNINRVVWLVSDPQTGMKNFEDLVRPPSNQYKGEPFIPVEVIPVDTFPHTFQFTMIIILMRVSMRELVSPKEVNMNRFYGNPKGKVCDNVSSSSSNGSRSSSNASSIPAPFSNYPPPDLSWKTVDAPPKKVSKSEEIGLSQEQIAWLDQMSKTYQTEFDRQAWTESLKHQNRTLSSHTNHGPPSSSTGGSFPYPPPFTTTVNKRGGEVKVPPAINSSSSSSSSIPKGPSPEYWASYSKQYSSYMMSYSQQPSQPGSVDPVAWKQYCEQMANYWSQWAASGEKGASNHKHPPPTVTRGYQARPPLPNSTPPPPPPLPPSKSTHYK